MNQNYFNANVFMTLSKNDLKVLWEGYKRAVFEIGWYENDNPMLSYIRHYQKEQGIGGTRHCETMLLEAIAFKFIEEE